MTTKRNYNEIDDTESGFGSAESDHSPPEVKNFRFENGDIIDDQDGGGQATTRTSARIVQRTKDELKESGNELTDEAIEAINAIQNDHSQIKQERNWEQWSWEEKNNTSNGISPVKKENNQSLPEEKSPGEEGLDGGQAIRISARRVQRMKDERKVSESEIILDDNTIIIQTVDTENKQQKRAWEQWSWEDKVVFFEALNECGKNFEAIQVYFQKNSKNKQRGTFKNKDQIRTFYYRTWHKICKYVDFTEDYLHLKKSSKELYGLINFGEFRKRLGSQLDDKTGLKLRELIFKGHTSVKIKGKTHRIRTPTCPALKRLNETNAGLNNRSASASASNTEQFASTSSSVPSKLTLGLSPASTDDFDLVHRLSFSNPNVTFTLRPGRSLASVLEHLLQKWKNSNTQKTHEDLDLWIVPKPGMKLESPNFSVIGPMTSAALSLSSLKKDDITTLTEVNNLTEENDPTNVGWNIKTAKSISVGELFLMAAEKSSHLNLHYTWRSPANDNCKSNNSMVNMLAKLASSELSKKKSPLIMSSTCSPSANPKISKSNEIRPNSPTESSNVHKELENAETHEFRRPTLPLSKPVSQQHQAFKQQLETLMPKYNMRKGRPLSRLKRPLPVAKRPLQPAPALKSAEGHVKFRLLPAGITLNHQHPLMSVQLTASAPATSAIITTAVATSSISTTTPTTSVRNLELDPGNSNDSISSTLAFFEPQPMTSKTDHFLDSVLENSNSSVLQTPPRVRPTPPTSPSRAVSNDSWIPDLSTFLTNIHQGSGSTKNHEQKVAANEDSVQSNGSEVDRQLLSMMSESSVDFTSKFAKLASAVVGSDDVVKDA